MKRIAGIVVALVIAVSALIGTAGVASADSWCVWASSDEAEPVLRIDVRHCVPAP